jgi:hypothetical protein
LRLSFFRRVEWICVPFRDFLLAEKNKTINVTGRLQVLRVFGAVVHRGHHGQQDDTLATARINIRAASRSCFHDYSPFRIKTSYLAFFLHYLLLLSVVTTPSLN